MPLRMSCSTSHLGFNSSHHCELLWSQLLWPTFAAQVERLSGQISRLWLACSYCFWLTPSRKGKFYRKKIKLNHELKKPEMILLGIMQKILRASQNNLMIDSPLIANVSEECKATIYPPNSPNTPSATQNEHPTSDRNLLKASTTKPGTNLQARVRPDILDYIWNFAKKKRKRDFIYSAVAPGPINWCCSGYSIFFLGNARLFSTPTWVCVFVFRDPLRIIWKPTISRTCFVANSTACVTGPCQMDLRTHKALGVQFNITKILCTSSLESARESRGIIPTGITGAKIVFLPSVSHFGTPETIWSRLQTNQNLDWIGLPRNHVFSEPPLFSATPQRMQSSSLVNPNFQRKRNRAGHLPTLCCCCCCCYCCCLGNSIFFCLLVEVQSQKCQYTGSKLIGTEPVHSVISAGLQKTNL